MAIIEPDPGVMFARRIEEHVAKFREELIERFVSEFREKLREAAGQFAIDVQRYYDHREWKDHVEIVLKLPKRSV